MYVFGTSAFTPHKLVLCDAQPGNNAKTFVGPSCTNVDVDVVHTSDLMMIIRQSIYILSIITRGVGKL